MWDSQKSQFLQGVCHCCLWPIWRRYRMQRGGGHGRMEYGFPMCVHRERNCQDPGPHIPGTAQPGVAGPEQEQAGCPRPAPPCLQGAQQPLHLLSQGAWAHPKWPQVSIAPLPTLPGVYKSWRKHCAEYPRWWAWMTWGDVVPSWEGEELHRSLGPTREQHSWEKLRTGLIQVGTRKL